jgi:hypothetical protein
MTNFRPGCWIAKDRHPCGVIKRKYITFPTYRELKKNLNPLLEETLIRNEQGTKTLTVSRSLRGEWGERFEIWELINGEPKKVKEGWC